MTDPISTLQQIVASSSQLSVWALSILGGTVVAIVSTSYRRPDSLSLRLPYLLFLPGWAAVGYSLYLGKLLSGKYLASLMVKPDQVAIIASQINDAFADQSLYLLVSLVFFGFWLIIFLLTWIFTNTTQKVDKNEANRSVHRNNASAIRSNSRRL